MHREQHDAPGGGHLFRGAGQDGVGLCVLEGWVGPGVGVAEPRSMHYCWQREPWLVGIPPAGRSARGRQSQPAALAPNSCCRPAAASPRPACSNACRRAAAPAA